MHELVQNPEYAGVTRLDRRPRVGDALAADELRRIVAAADLSGGRVIEVDAAGHFVRRWRRPSTAPGRRDPGRCRRNDPAPIRARWLSDRSDPLRPAWRS